MMYRISRRLALLIAIVATIGCDRLTKHAATATLAGSPGRSYLRDTIRLEYAENTGGFLGVGANLPQAARTVLFTTGTGLMLLLLIGGAVFYRWRGWLLTGTVFVVAGGASNCADRVVRGSVIDFINVGVGPLRTGIFNVADMTIMLGLSVLMLASVRQRPSPNDDR